MEQVREIDSLSMKAAGCPSATYRCVHSSPWGIFEPLALVPFLTGPNSFGAPAWKTAPRDRFIGWCPSERERNLQLIVNNARFLILPWVQSQNLASKLLALAARLLPQDWHDRYAYRPVLLETFVDTQRFTGACYKAANWIHVGQTQGRGKLDRDHKADLPTKSIWLYPLSKFFRRALRST